MKNNNDIKFKNINKWTILKPTILVVMVACSIGVTWGIPQLFSTTNFHYPLIPLDNKIPTISWFIWFYYLTFPLGIATIYIMYYKDKKTCYNVLLTLMICLLISMVVYFVYQTEFIKPDLEGNTLSSKLLINTWKACNPTCCFPSQHVFMAFACILGIVTCKKVNNWYRIFEIFCAVMIILSTVFCKQHYVLDIVASVGIMSVIYLVIRICKVGTRLTKWEDAKTNKK